MRMIRSVYKLWALIILILSPVLLMAQDSGADSLRNEMQLLMSEAKQKMDSLTLEIDLKMTELENRMNDSLMKKQMYVENETAELQRVYELEIEKIQLKADKDSLSTSEVDKMVRNLETELEMQSDALNQQMSLEMELLNGYFEQLRSKIEKEAELAMQKIEEQYNALNNRN